jgi:hypothetical protein
MNGASKPIEMTNPLRDGIARVDGRLLLRALSYIAKHGGSTVEEVAGHLKISAPTAQRLFRYARKQFGVKITYRKINQPYVGAGEFSVEDWGVFEQSRVRRFLERLKKSG